MKNLKINFFPFLVVRHHAGAVDYCIFFSITISVEKKNKIEKWWQTRNFKGGRLIVSFHLVNVSWLMQLQSQASWKIIFQNKYYAMRDRFCWFSWRVLCVSFAPGEKNWFVLEFENVFNESTWSISKSKHSLSSSSLSLILRNVHF